MNCDYTLRSLLRATTIMTALAGGLAVSPTALAQDASPAMDDAPQFADIIVTANRRHTLAHPQLWRPPFRPRHLVRRANRTHDYGLLLLVERSRRQALHSGFNHPRLKQDMLPRPAELSV